MDYTTMAVQFSGKFRALAIAAEERIPILKDLGRIKK
jgi:hypothetical protein